MHALCQSERITRRLERRRSDARENRGRRRLALLEGTRGRTVGSPLGRLRRSQDAIPETTRTHAGDDVFGTSYQLDLRRAVRGESHVARPSTLERCQEGDGKTAEVASMATEHDFPSLTPQRSSVLGRSSDFHHGRLGHGDRPHPGRNHTRVDAQLQRERALSGCGVNRGCDRPGSNGASMSVRAPRLASGGSRRERSVHIPAPDPGRSAAATESLPHGEDFGRAGRATRGLSS